EQIDIGYPDPTVTGDPAAYTVWGSDLVIRPTPTRDLTLYFNFYRLLPDLTEDTDENDFFANAWEAIFFNALLLATKYGIEDPRTPVWAEEAAQATQDLLLEHSRATHSGRRLKIEEPA